MTLAWVLGRRGLLGSALCRALTADGTVVHQPAAALGWSQLPLLERQMGHCVAAFAQQAAQHRRWEIYWAAGVATMASSAEDMAAEAAALARLLEHTAHQPALMACPGSLAFASSAGAIYAGAHDELTTEDTTESPTTAYAHEKLKLEALVCAFARAQHGTSALIARISTLYGAGQAQGKQQGLLSYMARGIVRNEPVNIFVPFDTIRDYIHADDAAASMIAALRECGTTPGVVKKIIANECPTTIAEIISTFRRVAHRPPRIVTSASGGSALYARSVRFKSTVLVNRVALTRKSLLVGIAELMSAEVQRWALSCPPGTAVQEND